VRGEQGLRTAASACSNAEATRSGVSVHECRGYGRGRQRAQAQSQRLGSPAPACSWGGNEGDKCALAARHVDRKTHKSMSELSTTAPSQ
jgi:hypothetical protein